MGGGDGFSVMNDPSSPHHGYSMSQQGSLVRFDKVTGLQTDIQPVHPEGIPLRFNWNAGLALDPHDSTTIYLGSQFVHRSRDHGRSWEIISPDLTTNDPAKQHQMESGGLTMDATGAENHTTIVAIAPSPLERGVIWVGTDDGNVQLTRDDGATWTNVRANIQRRARRDLGPRHRALEARPRHGLRRLRRPSARELGDVRLPHARLRRPLGAAGPAGGARLRPHAGGGSRGAQASSSWERSSGSTSARTPEPVGSNGLPVFRPSRSGTPSCILGTGTWCWPPTAAGS